MIRGTRDCKVPLRWSAACLLLALFAVGCDNSPPTGDVAGSVTLDGQPYSDAAVMLLSLESGQAGGADIQSDGTFKLAAPLQTGNYKVYLAPKAVPADAAPAPVSVDKSVPEKYWNESTTDISVTINEGENMVLVELSGS